MREYLFVILLVLYGAISLLTSVAIRSVFGYVGGEPAVATDIARQIASVNLTGLIDVVN